MIPSLEGWPTKTKKAPSPHEVGLTPLDTNIDHRVMSIQVIYETDHIFLLRDTIMH